MVSNAAGSFANGRLSAVATVHRAATTKTTYQPPGVDRGAKK
jgi:hypothetical protein